MTRVKAETDHIPLQCTLCPNQPQFSDVSHLLTHISSKAHLSHMFQLRIRAPSDDEAKLRLEEFDEWYNTNAIDVLLSDRMAAKDSKKPPKPAKGKRAKKVETNAPTRAIKEEQRRVDPSLEDTPGFTAPTPKIPRSTQKSTLDRLSAAGSTSSATMASVAAIVPTPTVSTASAASIASTSDYEPSPARRYATPRTRRRVPNFAREESEELGAEDMVTPKYALDVDLDETCDITICLQFLRIDTSLQTRQLRSGPRSVETKKKTAPVKNEVIECLKLKGIQWPGMDLFDAATPEMKRVRNQRKDTSVLQAMMATSAEIMPTEVVYKANGEYRNSRDIFGPPSCDSSPIGSHITFDDEPSPKKRRAMPRKALSEISSNYPRLRPIRTRRIAAEMAARSPAKRSFPIREATNQPLPARRNPLANVGFGKDIGSSDHDTERGMTIGEESKKRGFTIFKDKAPEISPSRTESSLEEQKFEFPNPMLQLPTYPSKGLSNYTSPTLMARPTSSHFSENPLGGSGLITSEFTVHRYFTNCSPETKRRREEEDIMAHPLVSGAGLPPHMFFSDPSFNPLYSPYNNGNMLANPMHINSFHVNSLPRRYLPQAPQPMYDDFKSDYSYNNSTFQGDFKEIGNRYNQPSATSNNPGQLAYNNPFANSNNSHVYGAPATSPSGMYMN